MEHENDEHDRVALTEEEGERLHRLADLRNALGFASEHTELLPELAAMHPDEWSRVVGTAAAIQSTVQASRESEPCEKLFAINGTRSPCRPRTDGHCCWCERPI